MKLTIDETERIKLQSDFRTISLYGNRYENGYLKVIIYNRNDKLRRFAIVVSKKLGKAHDRNKLKRRIKEIYRLNKYNLQEGVDMLIIPKKSAMSLGFHELQASLFEVLNKAGIMKLNFFNFF